MTCGLLALPDTLYNSCSLRIQWPEWQWRNNSMIYCETFANVDRLQWMCSLEGSRMTHDNVPAGVLLRNMRTHTIRLPSMRRKSPLLDCTYNILLGVGEKDKLSIYVTFVHSLSRSIINLRYHKQKSSIFFHSLNILFHLLRERHFSMISTRSLPQV